MGGWENCPKDLGTCRRGGVMQSLPAGGHWPSQMPEGHGDARRDDCDLRSEISVLSACWPQDNEGFKGEKAGRMHDDQGAPVCGPHVGLGLRQSGEWARRQEHSPEVDRAA